MHFGDLVGVLSRHRTEALADPSKGDIADHFNILLRLMYPRSQARQGGSLRPHYIVARYIWHNEPPVPFLPESARRAFTSYDIAQTRKREKQIHVRWIHQVAPVHA